MTAGSMRGPGKPGRRRLPAQVIDFRDEGAGTHSGTGSYGRRWRITQALAGWRLEFRDPGDMTGTYAGTHATLAAAQAEAAR